MTFSPQDYASAHPDSPWILELASRVVGEWSGETLREFVPIDSAGVQMSRFLFGPIVSVTAAGLAMRMSLSNVAGDSFWQSALECRFARSPVVPFSRSAPTGVRKMLDLGQGSAVVYLDDLHLVEHTFESPVGNELLCVSMNSETGSVDVMSRHDRFPGDVFGEQASRFMAYQDRMPREGVWGVRWRDGVPVSVLCVTETETRTQTNAGIAFLEARKQFPPIALYCEMIRQWGMRPYLDSAELYPDGRVDWTLGSLGPC